ncbi:MAG: hypothetical protein V1717_03610, partial [Candidatus Micrarchaeota archaeon]
STAKMGALMLPIGEFSLIIAAAAAQFVGNPQDLVSTAFTLVLLSSIVSPFLFDRYKSIASFLSKAYPKSLRKTTSVLGKELHSLEKAYRNPALQNEFSTSLKSFIINLVVAFAIVYMSVLASFKIDLSFIPFLPKELSVNALILPLVIWPVFKAINDLKYIAYSAVSSWSKEHFPYWKRHHDAGLVAAEITTSFILTFVGVFACIVFYYFLPSLLLVPIVFALLAVMYLSKSIYALFEQAEDLESVALASGVSSGEVIGLSRELGASARKLAELAEEREKAMREIRAALKAGHSARARSEMRAFKAREQALLSSLYGLEKREERKEFREFKREERQTKKALEHYFVKQAPRILAEKRKAKLRAKLKPADRPRKPVRRKRK